MGVDPRTIIAANNNADLYAAMFASHGLNHERLACAFVGKDRPPPFYSNLTVLSPGHGDEIALQLRALAQSFNGSIGMKDSFCELDLRSNGFDVLFGASWIWREAGPPIGSSSWEKLENEADLLLWEAAWKQSGSPTPQHMFTAELMARPEIVFLGRRTGGKFDAGCIANLSETCIGMSNVFSLLPSGGVFAQATEAVASVAPHLPIVGYEAGQELDHARKVGFIPVGDLRILVAKAARF